MKTGLFYAFGAFLLVSCSGSQGKGSADSDSIEETASLVDSIPAEPRPVLTKDSIGGIFIGESVNDVPDAIEGLYTAKENGASPDAVTIVFKGQRESVSSHTISAKGRSMSSTLSTQWRR